jgi:hypothetical protein
MTTHVSIIKLGHLYFIMWPDIYRAVRKVDFFFELAVDRKRSTFFFSSGAAQGRSENFQVKPENSVKTQKGLT